MWPALKSWMYKQHKQAWRVGSTYLCVRIYVTITMKEKEARDLRGRRWGGDMGGIRDEKLRGNNAIIF